MRDDLNLLGILPHTGTVALLLLFFFFAPPSPFPLLSFTPEIIKSFFNSLFKLHGHVAVD